MSNCTGCHNAFGDHPNPHDEICKICIRNPKYPTKRMQELITIDGIEVKVPQDMYIARDRKNFEEKKMLRKLAELMKDFAEKSKRKPKQPDVYPWPYWDPQKPAKPWEYYWDWTHRMTMDYERCQTTAKRKRTAE